MNTPLTLTEKILYKHLYNESDKLIRGEYAMFKPDRVIMQDATAQMALLQFMNTGQSHVKVPTSIHCDHLIQACNGRKKDLISAENNNEEVYEFLQDAAEEYGIDFWGPGQGIIHQIVLENYAQPGMMIVGTDSHTPNAGGAGALAIGVGGNDAVDVMMGQPWELKVPKIIGVHLTGKLRENCSPKDIILYLLGSYGTKYGTNKVFEYYGDGVESLTIAGRATICNMGAEMGATSSIFPSDEYQADENCIYDGYIDINLDEIEPYISGPFSPDRVVPVKKVREYISEYNYPKVISDVLIGSCTNSSYEDLVSVAKIIKHYERLGVIPSSRVWINPGSQEVVDKLKRNGYYSYFERVGAKVLCCACGPCIGQWKRDIDHPNSIVTTYNRNFAGRNDGYMNTYAFVTSPRTAILLAYIGEFDDVTGANIDSIYIRPDSDRLQRLEPFDSNERFFDGNSFKMECELLTKVQGKCTTDHISPGGSWLQYRGHLENISANLLNRAICAFDGHECTDVTSTALALKKQGKNTIIVAEDNYGEGSSREHAAMEPRFVGVRVILAKSFARIHETNLKKQGILALTFDDPTDYDKIREGDVFNICTNDVSCGTVVVNITHTDGSHDYITCNHTYNDLQINWLKAGSSINYISKTC